MSISTEALEELVLWSLLTTFLFAAAATICFMRISMTGIEKRMKEAGEPQPWPWDKKGFRGTFYMLHIVLPNPKPKAGPDPLREIRSIDPYVCKRDHILAYWMLVAWVVLFLTTTLCYFSGVGEEFK